MNILSLSDLWTHDETQSFNQYPHLSQTLSILKKFIEATQAGYISAYQAANSSNAPVVLPCLVSGLDCKPKRSIVTKDKTVFIEYDGLPAFWLITSNMSKGYPPSAFYLPKDDVLIKFDDPIWGVRPDHIEDLKTALLAQSHADAQACDLLATGDQNFAHVLWNQLPALMALMADPAFSNARIVVTHEPLGPLNEFIPDLDPSRVLRKPPSKIGEVHGDKAYINNPGSLKIPASVMARVHTACERLASGEARDLRARLVDSNSPNIWLSLRMDNRTADNQEDMLVELITRIYDNYDNFNILIDGFSLANDLDSNPDYHKGYLRDLSLKTRAGAERIIERISEIKARDIYKNIYNICGFKVSDSLYLAQIADFYVCHHGTVQHKVGWTANCPGIVHSNSEVILQKPEYWAASMIENGVRPVYIRKNHVRDSIIKESSDPRVRDLRHGNYFFSNIPQLIDDIMPHLERALHRAHVV